MSYRKQYIQPQIEKNIPIPVKQNITTQRLEFIKKLEIGDSFIVNKRTASSYQCLAKSIERQLRSVVISDEEARVWRIK